MNKIISPLLACFILLAFCIPAAKALNNPPVAKNDTINTREDTSNVIINILANDFDPDGDAIRLSILKTRHGHSILASGTINYTPNLDFNGIDTIEYQICDNGIPSLCTTAFVIINISDINDAPIANDDEGITNANTAVLVDVLKNDYDIDKNPIGITISNPPLKGTAIVIGAGVIQYMPNPGFSSGSDQLIYQVCDNAIPPLCNTAKLKITLPIKNLSPFVTDEDVFLDEDTKISVDVLANDYDANNNPLTLLILNPGGKAVISSPGIITYTPPADFTGSDVITYVVCDNATPTLCSTGSMLITVNPINDFPIGNPDHINMTEDDPPYDIDVLNNDTDIDGDPLFSEVLLAPSNGIATALPNGKISFKPNLNYNGTDQFIYKSCDVTAGLCDTSIVFINISKQNDAPYTKSELYNINEDDSSSFNILFNDIEPDGDAMNVSLYKGAAHGTAVVNTNGSVSYKPNANFNGNDVVYLNVCDTALCTIDTLYLYVIPVNDSPIAVKDILTITEDSPSISIDVKANDIDIDGDPLSVSIYSPPSKGIATPNGSGGIDYIPNPNASGKDSMVYEVCDAFACSSAYIIINIIPANDAPVANPDYYSNAEDVSGTINVELNDIDFEGDPLLITIISGPNNGVASITNSGTAISYTPNLNYNGNDQIIYQICDNATIPLCDTSIVNISISSVNDSPIANSEHLVMNEDAGFVPINVLSNDFDPEGDPITISIIQSPSHGLQTNSNGVISYSPFPNYNGKDSIVYQLCDNFGACDTAILIIDIVAINDAPLANSDPTSVNEDNSISINILANDIDVDGDPLTISIIKSPLNGTALVTGSNNILYNPNANYFGTDVIIYEICDNGTPSLCDTAVVNINILSVNDAPMANTDHLNINEDTKGTFNPLNNDSDVEGDLFTINTISPAIHGVMTIDASGNYTYTPNKDFFGTEMLIYKICDNATNSLCDTAYILINVNSVNDAPIANSDHYILAEDSPKTPLNISSNDIDIDNNQFTISIISPPINGTASVNAIGGIDYKPKANFNGTDQIIYRYCDKGSPILCDTAKIFITITPVNDAPSVNSDHLNTNEDAPITFKPLSNDFDVDGDLLIINSPGTPSHGTVTYDASGNFTYTPFLNYFGSDVFIYKVCDNASSSLCDTAKIFININSVNDSPIANTDHYSIPEDSPNTSFKITSNDNDVDGNVFTVTIINPPITGTAVVNTVGGIDYIPQANYNGMVMMVYSICDKGSPILCDTAKIFINVTPVNDSPVANTDHYTLIEDAAATNLNVISNDTDIEGDPLKVTIIKGPSNGSASVNTNYSIKYKPKANFNGIDTLIYQSCDNGSPQLCDTAKLIIKITPVNDPPLAKTDHKTIAEDSGPSIINVLSNDKDPESDPMSVTLINLPKNGIASINSSGNIVYTPSLNYFGIDSLIYSSCDNGSPALCDTAYLIINITPVNDAPAANTDHLTILEDGGSQSVSVLSNDFDIEGDALTVSIIHKSSNSIVNISGNKIIYNPKLNYNGTDTIIYQACDNGIPSKCDTAMLLVNVTSVNDKPKAVNDSIKLPTEFQVAVNLALNDTNTDTDILTYSILSAAYNGTANIASNGTLTYLPNAGFEGKDSLSYLLCDDGNPSLCDTGVVYIFVKLNHAPIAINDSVYTDNSIPVLIYASKNDFDPENDLMKYSVYIGPQNGTVSIQSNGSFIYRPNSGFSGKDKFQYEVCDVNIYQKCSYAEVSITVGELPAAPNVYNGFSPNGDGINDAWQVNEIEQFPDNQVFIINRWGSEVWKTQNYNNSSNAWIGKNMFGDDLPDGTYYYIIKFDPTHEQKGWVVIKR